MTVVPIDLLPFSFILLFAVTCISTADTKRQTQGEIDMEFSLYVI